MKAKSRAKPASALKASKVQLRLRPAQKNIIARAAQIKQTTLTGFMVENAYSAAQQVLADQVNFVLSAKQWDAFCDALDRPPREIPALRKLLTEPGVLEGN